MTERKKIALASLVARLSHTVKTDRTIVLGIAGAPGCGKSTLAGALTQCLGENANTACCLSLDNYYLSRAERSQLANRVHPLCRQRGVPGSHDLELLLNHLDQIRAGNANGLQLPVFDKSRDDRLPRSQWQRLEQSPRITVLEGWCVGVPPAHPDTLSQTCNQTEQLQDPDGRWRRTMLGAWGQFHQALRPRLDQLWYIRVPDWSHVIKWRWQQEQQLKYRRLAGPADVSEFLGTFERIVNHMQSKPEQWADRVLHTNQEHEFSLSGRPK